MPKARSGFIFMKHPDTEAHPVEVPRKSFQNHWSNKGWVEATDEEVDEALAPEEDKPLSEMSRDELDALATSRGLNPSDFNKKADLVAALES